MTPVGWFLVIGIPVLIALLILEGRRQEKRHGRGAGTGARLMRAGMLEMQTFLEPEKKVEILLQDEAGPTDVVPAPIMPTKTKVFSSFRMARLTPLSPCSASLGNRDLRSRHKFPLS